MTINCHQCISKSSSSFKGQAPFHSLYIKNTGLSITRLIDNHKLYSFVLLVIKEKDNTPFVSCPCRLFTRIFRWILTLTLPSELQSEPAHKNLKWTVQVLLCLCCKHSPSTPAYWGNANCRKIRGHPHLVCASISQNLCTDIKIYIYFCQSQNRGILGYFSHSPTTPRHCTFLRHTSLVKRMGYRTGCELQQQLKAYLLFSF